MRPAESLKHALLNFSQEETIAVAAAFTEIVRKMELHLLWLCNHARPRACAHPQTSATTRRKSSPGCRKPACAAVLAKPQAARRADHPVWGGPGWKVYQETRADMERVVKYIRDNPLKICSPPAWRGSLCALTTAGCRAR